MNRLFVILSVAAVSPAASAQSGAGFDFSFSRTAAGGGVWTGSGFELHATVGQHEAGESAGGPFRFLSGIWGESTVPPAGPASCDPAWKFGLDQGIPGISQMAMAVTTWDPDGNGPAPEWLVIAGGFVPGIAGDIFANNIAAWDGSQWHDLAGGVQGQVWDLIVHNGDLIVGGAVWEAGGTPVNGIARFDGFAWHALDTGVTSPGGIPGTVRALAVYQGALIAAGTFENASGLLTRNIARWNGATWQGLGFGIDGQEVRALAVLGSELYAGGDFLSAGGVAANNIARWNGAAWSPLGTGVNSGVWALAALANGTLAVGGTFIQAGSLNVPQLAIWAPGGTWQNPFGELPGGAVLAIREVGNHLIVGGAFSPSISMVNIAAWNVGAGFQSMGFGANGGAVWDIGVYGGRPVIAGQFQSVGPTWNVVGQPTPAWGVAIFDNALCPVPGCSIIGGWRRLTPGVDAPIRALAVVQDELIAGGSNFGAAGMINPAGLARWNESQWSTMVGLVPAPAGGSPGTSFGPNYYPGQVVINAIIDYQGWTVAAGQFNQLEFTSNITSWTPGLSFWGQLFFDSINGWQDLNAQVNALASWDADGPGPMGPTLVAGGDFTIAGRGGIAASASRIAGFRLGNWNAFGSGVDGPVHALTVHDGDLFVGGQFSQAGGVPASRIARLTFASGSWIWSPLGSGINGSSVNSLASHAGSLYVGGQFDQAGPIAAPNIARWDGAMWHPLADGLGHPGNSPVLALTTYRGDLYAGGSFQGSFGPGGAVLMNNIARWDGASWHPLDNGIIGQVLALAVYRGRLVVGGGFSSVDGRVSHSWARWEPDIIAPALRRDPSNFNADCGADAGFNVELAYGTAPGFQWRRNGVPLLNGPTGTGSIIENATTPALRLRTVSHADQGVYDCVVQNACGSVTIAPATLTVCYADCNCDGALNVADFGCFQTRWAFGNTYADCNGDGALNVADFGCFLTRFALGCP